MDMPQEFEYGSSPVSAREKTLVADIKVPQAVQDTLGQRAKTHGDFIINGGIMQTLKEECRAMLGWKRLLPHQKEALDMICHKVGRILTGNPNDPDHWHDIAGYSTLVENIIKTGKSHPEGV